MTKEELEKVRVKTCSTCKHFSKDVDTEEPCKSCYRQSYWEIKEKKMNKEELREKRNRTIESLNDIKAILGLDELYIDELEKELADAKKVQVVEHFEAYGQCRDSRRITELEQFIRTQDRKLRQQSKVCDEAINKVGILVKENTELKEQLEIEQNAKGDWFGKAVTKDRRLIEAKEIIRDFLSVAVDYIDKEDKNYSFIVEAEQFLEENV